MNRKQWLWACALLSLVCVPLDAQEPAAGDTAASAQERKPEPQAESSTAGEKTEEAPREEPEPPEEQVSADNNLSFPADI